MVRDIPFRGQNCLVWPARAIVSVSILHLLLLALKFLLLPLHFLVSALKFLLLPLCITNLLLPLHFLHLLLNPILLTLGLRIDASLICLLCSKHRFRTLIRDVRISTGSQRGRR